MKGLRKTITDIKLMITLLRLFLKSQLSFETNSYNKMKIVEKKQKIFSLNIVLYSRIEVKRQY
jgi:hypothetical protein